MGSAGDTAETLILDAMFGSGKASNMPATLYFALFTTTPSDAGVGTEVGASATAYARVGYTNNNTTWAAATVGTKTNAIDIVFPAATASWGTIAYWGAFTVSTVGLGVPFVWGALSTPTLITTGMTPKFLAGDLVISAD